MIANFKSHSLLFLSQRISKPVGEQSSPYPLFRCLAPSLNTLLSIIFPSWLAFSPLTKSSSSFFPCEKTTAVLLTLPLSSYPAVLPFSLWNFRRVISAKLVSSFPIISEKSCKVPKHSLTANSNGQFHFLSKLMFLLHLTLSSSSLKFFLICHSGIWKSTLHLSPQDVSHQSPAQTSFLLLS